MTLFVIKHPLYLPICAPLRCVLCQPFEHATADVPLGQSIYPSSHTFVHACIRASVDQPIKQSTSFTNPAISTSVDQWIDWLTYPSINELVTLYIIAQSFGQLFNPLIHSYRHPSIRQSIKQSISQVISQVLNRSINQAISQQVNQSINWSNNQLIKTWTKTWCRFASAFWWHLYIS